MKMVRIKDFWKHVDKNAPDGCWPWMGNQNGQGYGRICSHRGGHTKMAHRVSYELTYGPIPEGLCVCHRCDNPLCVRPDHLFLGTKRDNIQDCIRKGRFTQAGGNPERRETHWAAKLTWQTVREIRQRYQDGDSVAVLSRSYNMSDSTISDVVHYASWRE